VEKLMALYDKKTDRINKTRARVTRARRGASVDATPAPGSPGALGSSTAAGAGFAIHSALDDVHCEDVDSDGEGSAQRFDGAQVADQVAECEDEIDRLKQRHDKEVAALRAQVCSFR
jgi:hypothetical protein